MKFRKETYISAPAERVFAFHELPDAFERLLPPWEDAKIVQKGDISEIGSRAIIEQKVFGLIPTRWVAEHTQYDPPRMFEDVQVSGPFAEWRHRHIVTPEGEGALLIDDIEYEPPLGFLGSIAAPMFIRPKLEKMFDFRHSVTKEWCESESG
jgi:hypothetical protein